MGHANKRAHQQHHWRFGHGPRMPGYSTQRVGPHSVSGLMSRDSITYHANKRVERAGGDAGCLWHDVGGAGRSPAR